MIKKSRICDARLLNQVTAFNKLVADEHFLTCRGTIRAELNEGIRQGLRIAWFDDAGVPDLLAILGGTVILALRHRRHGGGCRRDLDALGVATAHVVGVSWAG